MYNVQSMRDSIQNTIFTKFFFYVEQFNYDGGWSLSEGGVDGYGRVFVHPRRFKMGDLHALVPEGTVVACFPWSHRWRLLPTKPSLYIIHLLPRQNLNGTWILQSDVSGCFVLQHEPYKDYQTVSYNKWNSEGTASKHFHITCISLFPLTELIRSAVVMCILHVGPKDYLKHIHRQDQIEPF